MLLHYSMVFDDWASLQKFFDMTLPEADGTALKRQPSQATSHPFPPLSISASFGMVQRFQKATVKVCRVHQNLVSSENGQYRWPAGGVEAAYCMTSCGVFVSNFYEYFSHLACQLAVSTVDAERAYSKLRAVRRNWHAL